MRRLVWLIILLLILVLVIFAIANRQNVALDLWPLPWSVDVPVYLAVLGPLGLGIIVGSVLTAVSGASARRRTQRGNKPPSLS